MITMTLQLASLEEVKETPELVTVLIRGVPVRGYVTWHFADVEGTLSGTLTEITGEEHEVKGRHHERSDSRTIREEPTWPF